MYGYLSSHPEGEAVVIDSNGSFAPARLRDVFASRFRIGTQKETSPVSASAMDQDAAAEALKFLDRVNFTRAFDVVGISEAISEVAEGWARCDQDREERAGEREHLEKVIPSSQDEDEDGNEESVTASQPYQPPPDATGGGIGMIIIDNVATHLSQELSKNPIRGFRASVSPEKPKLIFLGQALLASMYRSLNHLTKHRRICTILVNNIASPPPSGRQRAPDENVSQFASVQGQPALGRTLAYLVDASIFLSMLPRTRDGVSRTSAGSLQSNETQYVRVLEVLKDRNGLRSSRWVVFDIVDEVRLVPMNSY